MMRVMLVDDEPIALEGLRLLIHWDAEGFVICAECSSALDALAQIPQVSPDLIVTDIRMPGMDGLAFMLAAREQGYNGQFVIVSGYGDFEYAQQALRIGVSGYLLKPIEPDEASEVLEHVRRMVVTREASRSEQRAEAQRCLTSLLCGQSIVPGKLPSDQDWRLATWGAPLPFDVVRDVIATFPEDAASAHIVEAREYLALHWQQGATEPAWTATEALLYREHRSMQKSERIRDISDLPALRKSLAAQLDQQIRSLPDYVHAIGSAVALRQVEEFKRKCAELCAFCNACGADAKVIAKCQFIAECARQLAGRPEALRQLLTSQDLPLEAIGLLAIRLLAPTQERISDRVTTYVEAHSDERLSVESVANSLGYNATYLGRVFRDEQGLSFREWLSGRRIEKAARLLKESDTTVCRVAQQVGYVQYRLFLEHFKHLYGETPEQYRKRHGNKTV